MMEYFGSLSVSPEGNKMLTETEKQVFSLIYLTDKQIGSRLHFSAKTVGNCINKIKKKLGVETRVAALWAGMTMGLEVNDA